MCGCQPYMKKEIIFPYAVFSFCMIENAPYESRRLLMRSVWEVLDGISYEFL
jgi:hypothetical protein